MGRYLIPIILILLILFGCAQRGAGPPISKETKQIIEVEVVDQTVRYHCQSFWTQDEFLKLSEDDLIVRFKEKYNVDARKFAFSFDEANRSTTIECHIYGAISKGAKEYTADFLWLLNPLGLDFIKNEFDESNHGLSWEGTIKGVPTTIKVECPRQESVYKDWQHPVGHCHGHVWWPVS